MDPEPLGRPHEPMGATGLLQTPLGGLRIEAVPEGICRVEFVGEAECRRQDCGVGWSGGNGLVMTGLMDQAISELSEFFAGRRREFTVPVAPVGTAFQQRVWRGLLAISYAERWSYRQLAERVGTPLGQRAVGSANGRNPVAILIPCHRVVAKADGLGGYNGGVWRKRWLLDFEASHGSGD